MKIAKKVYFARVLPDTAPMKCKPTFERTAITSGSLSQIICSCGWESATYFGREDFACEEWKRHAKRPSSRMTSIGMEDADGF